VTCGLVAIVKDEADRIDAFIQSAMAVCSSAVIVDTGSTDGTREMLDAAERADPRIAVHDCAWQDFGYNRSVALALARGTADWLLALDADMTVEVDPGFDPDPALDAYTVRMGSGSFEYRLPLLLRGDLPWRSVGAVHEYTCLPDRQYTSRPTDAVRVAYPERSSPAKSAWHAKLLEAELARDPDNARTVFYLAQTCRDMGRDDDARELYLRRAQMGGYAEEAFYAAYRAALLAPWPQRAEELLRAWEGRPARLEPLHALLTDLNSRGLHQAAYALSGVPLDPPGDSLFVHREAWDWGIAFERAIAAWWTGHREEAAILNTGLLARPDLPQPIRAAVERNASF
jgi:hypothetical protein